ncbi:glycine zipper 2TM domain-containing protein [Massilia psychrophila]|uniref:Glycine zipper 2TM domain-containing protein n=1 Tax=Massilia psychrophila TaxID=1603353 RepID=A0A2G8T4Z5_9BURK|nr:glycine zipper 2TM domain-containing protein [Massilia psychrophila]PIL41135.1 hypothetical protein CR103_03260 [Massilia psychrophila]GGE66812.1 hypothetical protein GCM10008020_08950 [Massilia psychrophila]
MESIKTATRIHPLMAAAAVSVVIVSLAGTAAITGLLPNSRATIAPAPSALPLATQLSAVAPAPTPAPAPAPMLMAAAAPQPKYLEEPAAAPVVRKAPVVKQAPRHVAHRHTQVARNDYERDYQRNNNANNNANYSANNNANYSAPAVQQPAPAQPNYVGIGLGAVVGGLLGNQVGGGNGKKLATVAGVIGGGMLGNQIANGNR